MWFTLVSLAFATPEFHAEASSQLTPSAAVVDVRARVEGEKDAYLMGAMRVNPWGEWLGRAGIGVDVLGEGDGLDLKLGLFVGGVGELGDTDFGIGSASRPALGGEFQIGARAGRVYGYYRHMDGMAGFAEDHLSENEFRVGFVLTDSIRVHGQYVVFNPGATATYGGVGAGVEAVF